MAKAGAAAAADTSKNNDKPQGATAPEGYVTESTDVVGFWDGDKKAPIHGVPLFVNLSDSTINKSKPSALIFIRVIDPCKVQSSEGEGKLEDRPEIETKRGDIVGVWFSAGMRDILMGMGRPTFMIQAGEKKIPGKPSPMKVYKVQHPKGSQPRKLVVRDDRRQESAGANAAPFAGPKKVEKVDSGDAGGYGDDIPF